MDYNEFLEGMSSFKHSGDKALRFCFDIYDTNGAGCINLDQLKAVLSCVTTPEDLHEVSSTDFRGEKKDGADHDGEKDLGFCVLGWRTVLGRQLASFYVSWLVCRYAYKTRISARYEEPSGIDGGHARQQKRGGLNAVCPTNPSRRRRLSLFPSFILSLFFSTGELEELFKRLDADGNGTIDYDEFKVGVEKEPLLVKAFLAPVQQGSLTKAPAADRSLRTGAGADSGEGQVASSKTARNTGSEGHATSGIVVASPSASSPSSLDISSANSAVEAPDAVAPEGAGSRGKVSAPKDDGVGCAGNALVGGGGGVDDGCMRESCDNASSKRCRVEGPDCEEDRC